MPIFSLGDDEDPEPFLSQAAGASKAIPKPARPAPAGPRAMHFDNALGRNTYKHFILCSRHQETLSSCAVAADDDEDDPFEAFNVDKDDMDTNDPGSHALQQRQQRTAACEPDLGGAGKGKGSSSAAEEQQAVHRASQHNELQAGIALPASQPADESRSAVTVEVEKQQSLGVGGAVSEKQLQSEAIMEDVPDETELQAASAPARDEPQHASLRAEEAVVGEAAALQRQQPADMELDGASNSQQADPAAAGGGSRNEQQLEQDAGAALPPAEDGDATRREITPRDFRIVSTDNAATLPHTHEVVKHLDFGLTPARPGRSSLHTCSPPTSAGPQAPVPPAAAAQKSAHTAQESDGTSRQGPSTGGAAGGQAAVEAGSKVHNEALLQQNLLVPGGISLQSGSVARPCSQLTQLGRNPDPSEAGTGAQPEQVPAGRVPAEQAAASAGGAQSPGQAMPHAELSAPAAASVAVAADAGGPAGRPEAAAAAGDSGPLEPMQTVTDAAAGYKAPPPGHKVAAADAEPGCRASGRADGSAGAALPGLSAPAAAPPCAPPAPDMEQEGATTAVYARTLEPQADRGRAPTNSQQGGNGGQAAPHGQAQAEADPKLLAGPSPMQGLLGSTGKPSADQQSAHRQPALSQPSSASLLHFSHPSKQPQMQQAGLPLLSGQAAAVLAGHGLSRGPATAGGRNSPVAVSLPTPLPSTVGAPGSLGGSLRPLQPSMSQVASLGGSLRPLQPSMSQAANGPLLGGGPQQTRMPLSTAAGASVQSGSACAAQPAAVSIPPHRPAHQQHQPTDVAMHAGLPRQGLAANQGGHVPRSQPMGLLARFPGTTGLGWPQPRPTLALQGAAARRQQPSMAGALARQAWPVSGPMTLASCERPQGIKQGFSFHGCSSQVAAGTSALLHAPVQLCPTAAPRASAAQQAASAQPANEGHRQPRAGDRPLRGGDGPCSGGSRRNGGGDRERTEGDRPLNGLDESHSRGSRPQSGGDRPPAGGHRQPAGEGRPLSGRAGPSAAPASPTSKAGSGRTGPSQGDHEPKESADSTAKQRAEETRQREAAEMDERMKRNDEALNRLQQAILEAQSMRDSIMEYTCQAAIYSNRLTRLNNPVVMKKLGDLKRRAEALVACDEQQCMSAPKHMPKT